MTRNTWENTPSTATPLSAASLNDLEARKPEIDSLYINVKDYPGGDAGQQLTNAIAALPSTGATLFIPRGYYVGAFAITGIDHLTIIGEGSSTVIHNTTASGHALALTNCDELTIADLRVQGTVGTFDGLRLVNCQRAQVRRVYCQGSGRYGIYAHRCFGIVVAQCVVGIDSTSPYPSGVTNCSGGLVLTWDLSDSTSGCNQFVVKGGNYVIGKSQGWAIEINHCEGGHIDSPIAELSKGGIYLDTCKHIVIDGYYCEFNPSGLEYATGTATTTNGNTAITGSSTLWNTVDGEGNINAMLGKFFIIGTDYGRVAAVASNTAATLEANWGGATAGGQAYTMIGCDLYMATCHSCTVNGGLGGGAVILKASPRNILNLTTERIFFDATSNHNMGRVVTNRASATATRIVDNGTHNRITTISYQDGLIVQDGMVYAGDTAPNWFIPAGIFARHSGGYALATGTGTTNWPSFILDNGGGMQWGSGGGSAPDILLDRGAAGQLRLANGDSLALGSGTDAGGNYIQFFEQTSDPAAGAANTARLFSKDNAAGKTRLEALFSSGGSQPIVAQGGESLTVASATALTLPVSAGQVYTISGTTTITSVVAADHAGKIVTLIFSGILTFTNGSNLKLNAAAGNFVTTANDTITLACDGTNWHEVSRQVIT